MEHIYEKMAHNHLFDGISQGEFTAVLGCLGAFEKEFAKHQTIIHVGQTVDFMGVVLKGSVKISNTDYHGNEVLVSTIAEGDLFAEVFACVAQYASPVSVVALEQTTVLLFDYRKMISTCSASCQFHQRLIANMLNVMARKSLYLNKRIDIISQRTLRDKILTYFHHQSHGAPTFTIPMNRENLANFLCADRSALSNELSKMKQAGLIDYHKNTFTIH